MCLSNHWQAHTLRDYMYMYFVCLAATTVAMIDTEACGDQVVSSDELSLDAWANARRIKLPVAPPIVIEPTATDSVLQTIMLDWWDRGVAFGIKLERAKNSQRVGNGGINDRVAIRRRLGLRQSASSLHSCKHCGRVYPTGGGKSQHELRHCAYSPKSKRSLRTCTHCPKKFRTVNGTIQHIRRWCPYHPKSTRRTVGTRGMRN